MNTRRTVEGASTVGALDGEEPTMNTSTITPDNAVMTTEVRSTTGSAPLRFTPAEAATVRIELEDGSSQLYDRRDLMIAVLGAYADDGVPFMSVVVKVADVVVDDRRRSGAAVVADPMRVTWDWDGRSIVEARPER